MVGDGGVPRQDVGARELSREGTNCPFVIANGTEHALLQGAQMMVLPAEDGRRRRPPAGPALRYVERSITGLASL